jgi:L-ascorbate metabolism protein UlaG (beta-lactamase superfamily)
MILFFVIVGLFVAGILSVGALLSAPKYRGPVSDHFDGKQFINPGGVKASGFPEVVRWMMKREQGYWRQKADAKFGERPVERVERGIQITFVNHSTFLIQVDGLNIITDPVWSKRVSPFSWVGPKRMRPPGIRLEDLPPIDIVMLSHNHYDHLDIRTLNLLKKFNPLFITPLGVKAFLDIENFSNVHELDWWQEFFFKDLKVQSVPAQHFSGRGMLDRDATLWCGFLIETRSGKIYFAGDTAYNEYTFKEIGERCKPDISIIPIGAYKPRWFMSPIHCSPEEAVKIHKDVNSSVSVASHFGTFPLADDSEDDPVKDLHKALKQQQVNEGSFVILEEGFGKNF